jgi:hypothetical protein
LGDDEYVREILEAAGFTPIRGTPHETKVRAPASAVVDPTLLQFMGVPSEREQEARQMLDRHLERFAVGTNEYEYPLAFTVYEATNPDAEP